MSVLRSSRSSREEKGDLAGDEGAVGAGEGEADVCAEKVIGVFAPDILGEVLAMLSPEVLVLSPSDTSTASKLIMEDSATE